MAFKRKILDGIKEILQAALLPSGAIVWFNRTSAPSGWTICDGTNGTPNLIGRYALGSKTNIGSLVEAGLPNITGKFNGVQYNSIGGAFSQNYNTGYELCGSKEHIRIVTVSFNASNANTVYGNSNTVTPPSTKLLPCMKI